MEMRGDGLGEGSEKREVRIQCVSNKDVNEKWGCERCGM